jgi:hypothetical protein
MDRENRPTVGAILFDSARLANVNSPSRKVIAVMITAWQTIRQGSVTNTHYSQAKFSGAALSSVKQKAHEKKSEGTMFVRFTVLEHCRKGRFNPALVAMVDR